MDKAPRQAGADELRLQFQSQGSADVRADRRRSARQSRRFYGLFAVAVGLVCLVLMVVRLTRGDGVGSWLAFYAAGVAGGVVGAWLARRGRTRWALAAATVGVACRTARA